MDTALWIAQILLALLFATAGLLKLRQPREKLVASMGWVEDFSDGFVKFVGGVELLGALGLILPAVTNIAPIVVPIAATGSPTQGAPVHHRQPRAGCDRRLHRLGSVR